MKLACAYRENKEVRDYIKSKGWKFNGVYREGKKCEIVVFPSLSQAMKMNFTSFLKETFSRDIEVALAREDLTSLAGRNSFLLTALELSHSKRGRKIKNGLSKRVKKGLYAGFPAPYGYKFKDGCLVIDMKEYWHVKRIFSLYRRGKKLTQIAEYLNSRKVPTKKGKLWKKQTVAKILKNPLYCGYLKWDGLIIKGNHKPIVSEKEYEEVLSLLKGSSYRPLVNDGFGFQSLK